MADEKIQTPKSSIGDKVHALARAGLSAIPLLGGASVELFQAVIQPPLEKRRIEWMDKVGARLNTLAEEGVDIESLQNNEQFVSAVMYASQAALKTHQEAKLTALRNAVINVALGQAPEEAKQYLFLDFVDSLTELHLQILALFQSPVPRPGQSMGGLNSVLEYNMPGLVGQRELYDQLWKDLYSRGLINTDSLHGTMSGSGLSQKRTTGLGDEFLRFISE